MWRFALPLGAMASLMKMPFTPSSTRLPWRISGMTRTGGLSWGPIALRNLLEVVVLVSEEGAEMIIHAMPLRPIYRKLLGR